MNCKTTPPRPAHGRADEKGIEALARHFNVWPLQGEPGRDWGTAADFVNRIREEHFRAKPQTAPAIAPTIAKLAATIGAKQPEHMSRAEQVAYAKRKAKP